MKKLYIFLLIGLLLVGTVLAVSLKNKELKLDKIYSDKLIAYGYDNYNYTEEHRGNEIKRCLKKETCEEFFVLKSTLKKEFVDTALPQFPDESYYNFYNETRIRCTPVISMCSPWDSNITKIDKWELGRMEGLAQGIIEKESEQEKTKGDEGLVKLKDK